MTLRGFGRVLALSATAAIGLSAVPARGADVYSTHRLSAALATDAAVAAIAACTKLGFAITATVVDADGAVQALIRGDGAGIHTVQAAQDKAFTAVTYKRPTSDSLQRQKANGPFAVAVKEPHMLLDEGGLPIRIGDELVGAIGVSGSAGKDEDCGNAGIDAIRSRMK
jgi:uncharacterized protein GlcG (DUF336 family)